MVKLELGTEEKQVLIDVLESYLSDLRMEISDTDLMDFREKLKFRKEILVGIVDDLKRAQ